MDRAKQPQPEFKGAFLRNEGGAAAIEFALVSVLFLTLLFAIIEATRAVWAQNTLLYALEEAARERLVDDTMTDGDISDFVIAQMDNKIDTSTVVVTVTTTTLDSGIDMLSVAGTIDYTLMLPLLPDAIGTIELTAEANMPL